MGQAPKGFKFPKALDQFGVPHGDVGADRPLPNGIDFWWDEFSGNTGNCWFDNTGADGTAASVTGPGDPGSAARRPAVGLRDERRPRATSPRTRYLVDCSNGPDEDTGPLDCDWWQPPATAEQRGGGARAAAHRRDAVARWERSAEALRFASARRAWLRRSR